ncbi:MAG: DUF1311 domain-containing protein [Phycisphaerae bacterium]|nr:DUF1311 domain-containing protein [Phycisphaerae bacterium]
MKYAHRRFSRGILCFLAVVTAVVCYGFSEGKKPIKPTLEETKAAYAQADKALNAAWKQIETKWKDKPLRLETLREKQRHWIRYRDYHSNEMVMRDYNLTAEILKNSVEHWQTMTHITRVRTQILRAILDAAKNPPELTGTWTDGYGGSLTLVKVNDDQVAFTIDVVRGPTYHLGNLWGLAEINDGIIRYTDKQNQKKYKKKPTWLTWIDRGNHLELLEANSHFYCGARAYFSGDYYRVGDVTQAQRQRVLKQARENPEW